MRPPVSAAEGRVSIVIHVDSDSVSVIDWTGDVRSGTFVRLQGRVESAFEALAIECERLEAEDRL